MENTPQIFANCRSIDLGCGPNKMPGAIGLDIHPYEGVDIVANLDQTPWALPASHFDVIRCSHVIEHVQNPAHLLKEIHRIARPGARLQVFTPHFSSVNSWSDPTHVRHLSCQWYEPFLKGSYLAAQTGEFELIATRVTFGKSLRCLIPKAIIKFLGLKHWEKHYAFMYPGTDIETELRVVKA